MHTVFAGSFAESYSIQFQNLENSVFFNAEGLKPETAQKIMGVFNF